MERGRAALHDICVMKSRLRNLTITLEEHVARWAGLFRERIVQQFVQQS